MSFIQRAFTLPSAMTPKMPQLPAIPEIKVPPPPEIDIKMSDPAGTPSAPLDPNQTAALQRARRAPKGEGGAAKMVLTDAQARKDEPIGLVDRPTLLGR